MTNIIQEIVAGFSGGLVAGIIGYATGIATEAIFEAFSSFSPLIPILGVIFALITFIAGISDAYVAGFSFSIGIVLAGQLLGDFVTVFSGLISIAGLVLSAIKK